jgi:high affinity Mn2+ porin
MSLFLANETHLHNPAQGPRTTISRNRVGAARAATLRLGLAILPVIVGASANADGQAGRLALKASPTGEDRFDWSGFYVGGHVGYGGGPSSWIAADTAGDRTSGARDLFNGLDLFKGTGSFFAGLQGGYNIMWLSRLLLGVEADASFPNTLAGSATATSMFAGTANFTDMILHSGTVRGRVGYAFDHWLLYATGGFAWSYDRFTRTQLAGGTLDPGTGETALLWRLGWTAGVGVELPVAPQWTARAEYLVSDFRSSSEVFPTTPQSFASDLTLQQLRFGLNYQFSDAGTAPDNTTVSIGPQEDIWNVHGQTTFTSQYTPPFRAPYAGRNSLAPNQARETWDATAFLGLRLWDGAELWINPEIDQGFGLSSTVGVAGFPSAEAYKLGADYPYTRLHRAFIRQTIDLGGETQKVAAGLNQFAGSQTADRLVITVGKFSVADVFDTNKYAHDPRSDFLNWAVIDTGTFDYAAEAWGYALGAAAEWYKGNWTLRGGVFDLSIVPNSTELDPSFQQFQWIGELERRYELWGHPGKIAVTGFLSRGCMGSYQDAIALAQIAGGPADIASVRQYRSRGGLSVNVEQEIAPDLGAFVRAGVANGNIEPYEFTDIDRTAAAGLALKGTHWGRPDDTFGFAGVINGISAQHEAFLNAGGLGILVGDGKLPHPGPEQIIETYYAFPVSFWRVMLDYQLIVNPAYNRDRGPVSVLGARLHAQF